MCQGLSSQSVGFVSLVNGQGYLFFTSMMLLSVGELSQIGSSSTVGSILARK